MMKKAPRPQGAIPEALEAILRGLSEMYDGIPEEGQDLLPVSTDKAEND